MQTLISFIKIPKSDKQIERIRRYYSNGAIEMHEDNVLQYIIYDIGDIVLFGLRGAELYVRGIITHDGLRVGDCK